MDVLPRVPRLAVDQVRIFEDGPQGTVAKVECDRCDRQARLRPSGNLPKGWCRLLYRGVHWGDKCPACRRTRPTDEEER